MTPPLEQGDPVSRSKALMINVLVTVTAVTLSLALFEAALRFILPKAKPGQVAALEYRHSWTLNSNGFRDVEIGEKMKRSGERIVFLGDSFTAGMGNEPGRTFADLIAGSLEDGHITFNLGKIGTNTADHLTILRDHIRTIRPRHVILFLYWNDIQENIGKAPGSVTAVSSPADAAAAPQRHFLRVPGSIRPLLQKSVVYQMASACYRIFLSRLGIAKLDSDLEMEWFALSSSQPAIEDGWTSTRHLLRELRDLCRRHDARLLLVYVPKREQFLGWEHLLDFYGVDDGDYDRFRVNARLAEICEAEGIELLDPTAVMLERGPKRGWYYQYDTHFTPAGNVIFYEAIREKLTAWLDTNSRPSPRA
jgi:lysophospholipase L1-like esterase